MTYLKTLLELFIALKDLALWIVQKEKEAKAVEDVESALKNKDQSQVESDLGSPDLGHTNADLPSVRIEPIKDRKTH